MHEAEGRGREARATALGVTAILLWASLALLTVETRGIPQFERLALCFGIAGLAGLAALVPRGRRGLAELRQPLAPWLLAFAALFLYHALYFFALSAAPAPRASLIAYLWPLLLVLLSSRTGGNRGLRPRHLAGALLGLAGTALVLLGGGAAAGGRGAAAGYAAAFAGALLWAGYSVRNRRYGQVPSTMLIGVCGAVAAAAAACHVLLEAWVTPDAGQAVALVLLGLGPVGLAFLAWDHATKRGHLPLLGALAYLSPLVSTLLLVAAAKAPASASLLAAALLVLGGAMLAAGRPGRRA
jgi:drug/metabolite transporter (DMT)-like permease